MCRNNFKLVRIEKKLLKFFLLIFVCSFLFFSENASATVNSDTMLGYLKFDGNGNDYSGEGSTGTLQGSATYSTSHADTTFSNTGSVNFFGSSGYASFANQPGLKPFSALTISFWINLDSYPPALEAPTFIAGNFDVAYPTQGFYFKIDSAYASFVLGNGSINKISAFPITTIPLSTWTLLTATWDGSNITLYRNSTNFAPVAASFSALAFSSTTFTAGHFYGKMDDLRLYERALTENEVFELAAGDHTSATWTGDTGGTDYENKDNWNIGAVPDLYTKVKIQTSPSQPEFSADESIAGLRIDSGTSLDLRNFNLVIKDAGDFVNNGSLALDNSQLFTDIVNDTGAGTIILNNTASITALKLGNTYNNLTLNGTGNVTLPANLIVKGDLTLNYGSLDANGKNISVGRRWMKTNGNFIPGIGTVTLNGISQTISGSNTFYNLTKNATASDNLYFTAGETQTITNLLTLKGVSSASPLKLRSTTTGTQWKIDPQGTRDIDNLDLQDSWNISSAITVGDLSIINSGNNSNWTFPSSVVINTSDSSDDEHDDNNNDNDNNNDSSATSNSAVTTSAITPYSSDLSADTAIVETTNTDTENNLVAESLAQSDSQQGQLQNPSNFESAQDSNISSSNDLNISTVEMTKGDDGKKIKISGK